MKWSDKTTFLFVEEYLKHECLFNNKSANYRNKLARDAALIKICEVMNMPDFGVKEAVSKIKSIRSTYSQEMKKVNDSTKSGAGTDEAYIPTLKWFILYHNVMKDKNLTPRESQSNLNSTEIETETMASGSTSQDVPAVAPTSQDIPVVASSSQDASITAETESARKPLYSRKRNIRCLDNLVNKVKAVGEMVQNTTSNNNNEFDIFGKSVAAQLNTMPLILALQAQSHIQNYLTSLRMHSIRNPLNIGYSPSPPSSTSYISSPIPGINNLEASLDNNTDESTEERSVTINSNVEMSLGNNDAESTQINQTYNILEDMSLGNNDAESTQINQTYNILEDMSLGNNDAESTQINQTYNILEECSGKQSTTVTSNHDILKLAVESIMFE